MADSDRLMADLRAQDRTAFLALHYAPEVKRPALAALYGFNAQVERIPELVSEPLPGEIRLQWWRDVIAGERAGEAGASPLASALLQTIEHHGLSRAVFDNLIEARIFDLYHDPMPDRAALEGYLGETRSVIIQMAAHILDAEAAERLADASGHGGCAKGIADIVSLAAQHRAQGRVFVPADILAAAGGDARSWLEGGDGAMRARALAALCALGREHLQACRAQLEGAPASIRPAFLPLATCTPVFRLAQRPGAGDLARPMIPSPVSVQWRMVWVAITGRPV